MKSSALQTRVRRTKAAILYPPGIEANSFFKGLYDNRSRSGKGIRAKIPGKIPKQKYGQLQ